MKKKYLMLLLLVSGMPFASMIRAQDSLFVNFTGMSPHLDQDLTLYLRDTITGDISDTVIVSPVDTADFQVSLGPLMVGNSYFLDFYADHNGNGVYDIPPTDHAWRIVLEDVEGDTTIDFAHNTVFTDITWMVSNQITLNFTGMDPHIGQELNLYLRNMDDLVSVDSAVVTVENADFTVIIDSVDAGDYNLDFYADHNGNGVYDSPPADHAWRIELEGFDSDTVLEFAHNTVFTDIFPAEDTVLYSITVNFTGMDPHEGQDLTLYVRYADDGDFLDSLVISPVDTAEFAVVFDSVAGGSDYNVDFWADLNGNGAYDTPPNDHAWRFELPDFNNDTVLTFAHNTNFTDIFPQDTTGVDTTIYSITVNFEGFDDNEGQNFIIYLRNPDTQEFVDSVYVSPIDSGDFTIVFDSVSITNLYNIDFYTDVNGNGTYDIPPVDHAWRIQLNNVDVDTVLVFVYDTTTFTDIGLIVTGVDNIEDLGFSAYPNPVKEELNIQLSKPASDLSIYNVTGAMVLHRSLSSADKVLRLNVSSLKPGMYILKLKTDSGTGQYKFLKE